MKKIESTNGTEILVSDEDFMYLSQWKWRIVGDSLVVQTLRVAAPITSLIFKRRGIEYIGQIDHKDRNPLNNQFENLRPATNSQNVQNQGVRSDSTTGYKGVSYHKARKKYQARIKSNGIRLSLGYYLSPESAAQAYDRAARRYFKDFAVLNFPVL